MRKSSLILLLAMAFVLTTVVSGFSASTIIDGPCKELCTKCWQYKLFIDDAYVCDDPDQGVEDTGCPLCPTFDYESSLGYCGNNDAVDHIDCDDGSYYNAPGVVFKLCECPDFNAIDYNETKSYGIKIEIMAPTKGVYFTNGNDSDAAASCYVDSCDGGFDAQPPADATIGENIFVTPLGDTDDEGTFCPENCVDEATPFALSYKPLVATDVLFDAATHDPTGGDECCLDCVGNLATSVITTCEIPFMRDGSPYLMVDLPTFVWDPKIMTAGDVVNVKITIVGEDGGGICPSCNDLCSCTVQIGIFGCPLDAPAKECKLCLPYFPQQDGAWWSAVALTNSGSDDASITMTVYAGGQSVELAFTVDAYSVAAFPLNDLQFPELANLPQGQGMYANVKGTVPSGDGFIAADITGLAILGDNNQAYGYLSKEDYCGCSSCCD